MMINLLRSVRSSVEISKEGVWDGWEARAPRAASCPPPPTPLDPQLLVLEEQHRKQKAPVVRVFNSSSQEYHASFACTTVRYSLYQFLPCSKKTHSARQQAKTPSTVIQRCSHLKCRSCCMSAKYIMRLCEWPQLPYDMFVYPKHERLSTDPCSSKTRPKKKQTLSHRQGFQY